MNSLDGNNFSNKPLFPGKKPYYFIATVIASNTCFFQGNKPNSDGYGRGVGCGDEKAVEAFSELKTNVFINNAAVTGEHLE